MSSPLFYRAIVVGMVALACLAVTVGTANAWKVSTTTGAVCDGSSGLTRDLPHKWRTLPVPYYIQTGSTTDLSATDQAAQVASGFTAWDAPQLDCSGTSSSYLGPVTTVSLGNGKNEVIWLKTGIVKPWPYDAAVLGLTTTISDREKGTADDQPGCPDDDRCAGANQYCPAVESDIELNNDNMMWSLDPGNPKLALVHTILAHEIGHFYGLGHDNEVRADGQSLMNYMPTASNPREDDKLGICTIYPKDAPLCTSDAECILGDICKAYTEGAGVQPIVLCPKTQACVAGACKDMPAGEKGTPCLTNVTGSCGSGLECKAPEGTWRGHCTGPCTTNEECGGSGKCVMTDDGKGTCVFGGSVPDGEACINAGDCVSGACDEGGFCAFSCTVDCDCADGAINQGEGLACENGACVPGRSTCYFPNGDDGDRKFTGTLCAVPRGANKRGEHTDLPWLAVAALGITLAVLRKRR